MLAASSGYAIDRQGCSVATKWYKVIGPPGSPAERMGPSIHQLVAAAARASGAIRSAASRWRGARRQLVTMSATAAKASRGGAGSVGSTSKKIKFFRLLVVNTPRALTDSLVHFIHASAPSANSLLRTTARPASGPSNVERISGSPAVLSGVARRWPRRRGPSWGRRFA